MSNTVPPLVYPPAPSPAKQERGLGGEGAMPATCPRYLAILLPCRGRGLHRLVECRDIRRPPAGHRIPANMSLVRAIGAGGDVVEGGGARRRVTDPVQQGRSGDEGFAGLSSILTNQGPGRGPGGRPQTGAAGLHPGAVEQKSHAGVRIRQKCHVGRPALAIPRHGRRCLPGRPQQRTGAPATALAPGDLTGDAVVLVEL